MCYFKFDMLNYIKQNLAKQQPQHQQQNLSIYDNSNIGWRDFDKQDINTR